MSKDKNLDKKDRGPILADERRRKNDDDEYEVIEVDGNAGCSGCGWGVAGLAGCITIPVTVILLVVLLGFNAIADLLGDLSCVLSPNDPRCVSTTGPQPLLVSVRELSVLLTYEQTYVQPVTTKVDVPYALRALYGDRLVLQVAVQVTAGIDLDQLTEDDILVDGTTLIIRLPPPQLQTCSILEDQTRVLDRDQGLFASSNTSNILDTVARQDALRLNRQAALESGILQAANTQAVQALTAVYDPLPLTGIDSIDIITSDPPPITDAFIPQSCIGRDA